MLSRFALMSFSCTDQVNSSDDSLRLASPRLSSPRPQSEAYLDRGVLQRGCAQASAEGGGRAWLLGAAALSIFVWVDNN